MISLMLFLFSGFLVNAYWIFTTLAMLIVMIGALVFYTVYVEVYDTAMIF